MAVHTGSASALRFLARIPHRYGSLEAFVAQLYREFDQLTRELPPLDLGSPSWAEESCRARPPSRGPGRHGRRDPGRR